MLCQVNPQTDWGTCLNAHLQLDGISVKWIYNTAIIWDTVCLRCACTPPDISQVVCPESHHSPHIKAFLLPSLGQLVCTTQVRVGRITLMYCWPYHLRWTSTVSWVLFALSKMVVEWSHYQQSCLSVTVWEKKHSSWNGLISSQMLFSCRLYAFGRLLGVSCWLPYHQRTEPGSSDETRLICWDPLFYPPWHQWMDWILHIQNHMFFKHFLTTDSHGIGSIPNFLTLHPSSDLSIGQGAKMSLGSEYIVWVARLALEQFKHRHPCLWIQLSCWPSQVASQNGRFRPSIQTTHLLILEVWFKVGTEGVSICLLNWGIRTFF